MFRYDVFIGSMVCILGWNLGCGPQKQNSYRDLPSLFPDARRALGPFSISMEKSRETNALSEARIKVQQGLSGKHITLQLRMLHIQEQVTVSFLHQSQPTTRINSSQGAGGDQGFEILSQGKRIHEWVVGSQTAQSEQEDSFNDPNGSMSEGTASASRCMPSHAFVTDAVAPQLERRTPSLQDASALFHIPLPLSIREASSIEVRGAGDAWSVVDGSLVWHQNQEQNSLIELQWTRENVPETRYPLQTQKKPQHLKARRIDREREEDISVVWHQGFVRIAAKDVKPGSWLELQYDVPGTDSSFMLPQQPVAEDMNTLVMIPGCTRENFILEKNHLDWSCPMPNGPVWAASYKFHQPTGGMDFVDWPELARLNPSSVTALWDAGEPLDVVSYGNSRVLPRIPKEASRVCMRATWTSDPAR